MAWSKSENLIGGDDKSESVGENNRLPQTVSGETRAETKNRKAKAEVETFFSVSPRLRVSVTLVIAASIVLVTVLHFLTPVNQILSHEIYQRLYYFPIIAAALLFGLRGGLTASLFTTVVYSPHIYTHWADSNFNYAVNQYAEVVIFNVVGGVMGALGDRLKKARERAERNAAERREAYDELQKTFEQLLQAEKLAALGELSAGIVHEVRNPLGSIKGAVEILEDELAPDSPRREFSDLAKKEIERLDRLVGEFLRFARPARLAVEPNDLSEITASVAALVENQAAAQSVSIKKDFRKNLPPVSVDAEQIKQVLLNLAINSLQAMPQGGQIVFRAFEDKEFCVVEIEDTGGGIGEEILPKIFDPFFTTKEKGVGLGLSVAHKIVVQHGGKLSAASENQKTVFSLRIPK